MPNKRENNTLFLAQWSDLDIQLRNQDYHREVREFITHFKANERTMCADNNLHNGIRIKLVVVMCIQSLKSISITVLV